MSSQVKLFNPNVTWEQFQQAIRSQAPDAEVTLVIMGALARFKPEELIKNLTQDLAAKVEACAKQRSTLVLGTVKGLNRLCDQKDELLESCPSYKAAKAALQEVQSAYYSLGAKKIEQAVQEVVPPGISSNLLAKLEKAKASAGTKLSPWAEVYDAVNALRTEQEQSAPDPKKVGEKQAHFAELLKRAITDSLFYGETKHMTEEEMDAFIQKDNKTRIEHILSAKNSEVREFITSILPNVRKEAIVACKAEMAAREKLLAEREAALKPLLTAYSNAFERYSTDDGYLKFVVQKQAVKDKFREIGAFCTASELYDHPKATNDSKTRLYKVIRSL